MKGKKKRSKEKKSSKIIVLLCLILIGLINGIYFYKFNGGLSDEQIDFSYYGTYISGTLGISLSFITIIILIKTLNEQTVNNRFIRAATEKQLVNAKEYYDKSEVYMYIKDKINIIESIANSTIDNDDIYYFIHHNDKHKIKKFICVTSDEVEFDNLMNLNKDEYKQIKIDKESNSVINFLNTINFIDYKYSSFEVPYTINYKVDNLKKHINNLAFLITQYLRYDNSITILNILLYEINGIIDILYEVNLFDSDDEKIYKFFKNIKDNPTVRNSIHITSDNLQEVKQLVYDKLLELNMIDNIGFTTFISMYTILSISDETFIVKDIYDKVIFRGVIKIVHDDKLEVFTCK